MTAAEWQAAAVLFLVAEAIALFLLAGLIASFEERCPYDCLICRERDRKAREERRRASRHLGPGDPPDA